MKPVVFAIALLLALIASAFSATKYVATNGNNSNSGDGPDAAQAWRTVSYAASQIAGGDTVIIRGGTYTNELIWEPKSGSPDHYTTFQPYKGEQVIIQGGGKGAPNGCRIFEFWGCSYMKLQGLILDGSNMGGGILLSLGGGGGGHYIIDRCEFRNADACNAIGGGGSATITHNEIHHLLTGNEGYIYGWYNTTAHNVFAYNTLHDISGWGIHSWTNKGGIEDNRIYGNVIYNCGEVQLKGRFGGILLSHCSGNSVYNNLVYGCGGDGIQLWNGSSGDSVYNNTVYGNCKDGGAGGISFINAIDPTVVNNISCSNHGKPDLAIGQYSGTLTAHHNLTSDTSGDLRGNPRFVNAAKGDFRLKAGSPAIDAGVKVPGIEKDLEGAARPQGKGYDLGAYEYRPRITD